MYEFSLPTKVVLGVGIIDKIGEYLKPDGGRNALITAGSGKWRLPLIERVKERLREAGWEQVEVFNRIEPNPTYTNVKAGMAVCKETDVEAIVAIGGGSPMDASKVIAQRAVVGRLCTVPTTAGTGGEISPWAVITNQEKRIKDSLIGQWPDVAILDPKLTVTLPPKGTLFTGLDAFIHGLEAYVSSAANAITDSLALGGMELIAPNLRRAVEHGEDIQARSAMMEGSLLTGASMLHASLGLIHAIGNVTGGLYHDLPHGLVLARCMDAVLDFNAPAMGVKYERIAPLVERVRADAAQLFQRFEIGEVEVAEADLPLLAERAVVNVNARTNPCPATRDDVEALARRAFVIQ